MKALNKDKGLKIVLCGLFIMIYESVRFRIGSCHVPHSLWASQFLCTISCCMLCTWLPSFDVWILRMNIFIHFQKLFTVSFSLKTTHLLQSLHAASYENPRDSSMHIYFIILIVGWICGCIASRGCFLNAHLLLYFTTY